VIGQKDSMTEFSEARARMTEQSAADATAKLAQASHRAMTFLFGAQRLCSTNWSSSAMRCWIGTGRARDQNLPDALGDYVHL
jgi:hypothetical protein